MGMTIAEKILARQSGSAAVHAGDLVVAKVETCVLLDTHSNRHAGWRWPKKLHDPDMIVLAADHIVMSSSPENAVGLKTMRAGGLVDKLEAAGYLHPAGWTSPVGA